ncbi:MAG: hypothetical protein HKN32_03180 [Flavobacteriales bacterium]|nr:hypothetical protein [Flavobacteriales bacterium]
MSTKMVEALSDFKTRFYQTFGMTETASHIALKEVGKEIYTPIGDVELGVDDRSCLSIKGTVTDQKWIQSNDVVEMTEDGFKWLGRADFVINSAGVKLHPEKIENLISDQFPEATFALSSERDNTLGERAVLVSTSPILARINTLRFLNKYEVPKKELIMEELPVLASGKLDRIKLKELVAHY